MTTDMVCGIEVGEKETEFFSEYKGKKYYFCGKNCKGAFEKDPKKYVRQELKMSK